jgi:hypothetical protein
MDVVNVETGARWSLHLFTGYGLSERAATMSQLGQTQPGRADRRFGHVGWPPITTAFCGAQSPHEPNGSPSDPDARRARFRSPTPTGYAAFRREQA